MKRQKLLEKLYLKPQWKKFISEYISNGFKGGEAYMKVYPGVKNKASAEAAASRLLRNVKVQEEIDRRLIRQGVTESAVIAELWRIAQCRENKDLYAAVKALALLAKSKGMLSPEKKRLFTDENPAIFLPVISREKLEIFSARVRHVN